MSKWHAVRKGSDYVAYGWCQFDAADYGQGATVEEYDAPQESIRSNHKYYLDSKKQAQDAARISLKAKLLALGLTADEINELGV